MRCCLTFFLSWAWIVCLLLSRGLLYFIRWLLFVVFLAVTWLKSHGGTDRGLLIGHSPSGLCSRSDWFKTGKAFRSRCHMSVFLGSDRCLAGWTAVGKTDGRLPGPMDGSALLWESANHRNIIWAKPLIWVKFTLHRHSTGQVWSCGNWQLWWERSGG